MNNFLVELITEETLSDCKELLIKNEKTCITLMSRFIKKGCFCLPKKGKAYAVFVKKILQEEKSNEKQKKLCAVLLIDNLLLHCIDERFFEQQDKVLQEQFCNALQPYITNTPFGIIGTVFGTELLEKAIYSSAIIEWEYLLFEFEDKTNSAEELPQGLTLRQCTTQDTRLLFRLQREYEIEEVLPPGSTHNTLLCISNLQKSLKEQIIYAIVDSNAKSVAKAGTNARGLYWDQLGGVFTEPAHRGRGYARILTHFLAHMLTNNKRKVALFVKKNNIYAQRAYKHAGFKEISPYKIVYY